MKYLRLFPLLLALATASAVFSYGQEPPPADDVQHDGRPDGDRPNLLAELGLSRDQIQQLRRLNQERRPAMMRAQRRMHDANDALDAAIYRDVVSDDEVSARIKDFQAAQADVARLRFENELSVRRILTPEQLARFRDMRRRFAEARKEQMKERRRRKGRGGIGPDSEGPADNPPPLN